MRRWSRRRRITATTMAVAVLGFGGVATAQQATGGSGSSSATSGQVATDAVSAVQQQLGVTVDGVAGPQTRKALRSWQAKNGLDADGVIGPATLKAMGVSAGAATSRTASAKNAGATGSADATLAKIAQCESGGNPSITNGPYRGKYQFTRATWRRYGGTGDPAAASEATQDRIAAKLFAARGTAPWPVCGK
jgi:peptidoglycan hydrolase-like protein with peptidoglycan-binding domain